MFVKGWVQGGRGMGVTANVYGFSFGGDVNVLKSDGSDSSMTL